MAIVLMLVCGAALTVAALTVAAMMRERAAMRGRVARAVRPMDARPIQWAAPARSFDRPGDN